MTGEISLTGKVLRIGGLKEKLVAARREGVEVLCLPESNKDSFFELDEKVRDGFKINFVKEYLEVFQCAFPDLTVDIQNLEDQNFK